jgi:hypothetical protein
MKLPINLSLKMSCVFAVSPCKLRYSSSQARTILFLCNIYDIKIEDTEEKTKFFVFPPIYHTKIDRENFVEVTSTEYHVEDL